MKDIPARIVVAIALIVTQCSHDCSAVVFCSSQLTGTINDNVECSGACTLNGATVNGDVICPTGSLVVNGDATVTGKISLSGSVTAAEIDTATANGALEVTSAGSLDEVVIKSATLGSVSFLNTDTDLSADGLTTTTVTVTGGNAVVELCGSSISGLVSVLEHTGNVVVDSTPANCAATTLSGGLSAAKGSGSVTVKGATIQSGDFVVLEYTGGDVTLEDATVSDLTLTKNTGSLSVINVNVDSDTSVTSQDGNVVLRDFATLGDVTIISLLDGDVTLEDSDLGSEDITISNANDVTIRNNVDLNAVVQENDGLVKIVDNVSPTGVFAVNKNTGGVEIDGNTLSSLACTDNNPAPTGSDNTVTTATGQCSTL